MHHLLATIFAFLFSFGTAQPAHQTYAFVAPPASVSFDQAIPSREELVSAQFQDASYAEAVCQNCQTTTDAIFTER